LVQKPFFLTHILLQFGIHSITFWTSFVIIVSYLISFTRSCNFKMPLQAVSYSLSCFFNKTYMFSIGLRFDVRGSHFITPYTCSLRYFPTELDVWMESLSYWKIIWSWRKPNFLHTSFKVSSNSTFKIFLYNVCFILLSILQNQSTLTFVMAL